MHQLWSGIRKEFLILIRDLPGLGVLFLMPVLLILIVSLAQKNALKSSRENKTEVLLLDLANSSLSRQITKNLEESGLFSLIRQSGGKTPDLSSFREAITRGDYPAGLLLAREDSAITIFTDPSLQPSFRGTITGSMMYVIKGTQSRAAIENLLKAMSPGMEETINSMISSSIQNMTPVKEVYAEKENSSIRPTLTQNLIPGFILFAMFFIALPLSGSMITEKNEGTWQRLKALPVSVTTVISAKVVIYLIVCLIQFMLMVLVGTWLLPVFFDIPALQLGDQYFEILVATIVVALAAIGFGLIVGSVASTNAQASISGSMTVVILGVISGTFLPVYLMPDFLQHISMLSPIRWGIDTYLNIFIRDASIAGLFPELLFLLLFFVLSMVISLLSFGRKK